MSAALMRLQPFRLQHWLDLPEARAALVGHFMALAATLAAAKVLLATVGVALFLANEGPDRLPAFYLALAGLAITMSFGLGAVVDRVRKASLARAALAAVLLGGVALRPAVALDVPGAYFLLLASAHLFEIVLDILFWVLVAAYLDSLELKRATPLLYMALALGGAAGGGLAHALSPLLAPADLLLLLLPLAAAVVAQVTLASRQFEEVPDPDQAGPDARGSRLWDLAELLQAVRAYPLCLLIALNALVLTILYGLSEYLVFSIYEAAYPGEQQLTRFLAVVFACLQMIEFGTLYLVTRSLLERGGPLLRNLIFPLTSLVSVVYLVASQRLTAAVVTHINAEAISNAIFQPVNNTNYVTLPLRFQGRARTLADGVFYPSGLALAGLLLLFMQGGAAVLQVGFAALVFASLFLALNVGVGVLFLPTLVKNLRSGIVHFGDLRAAAGRPVSAPSERIRTLLASPDPEFRALGLGLARALAPTLVLEGLNRLALGADRRMRRLLVETLDAAAAVRRAARATSFVEELLRDPDDAARLVALQFGLLRPGTIAPAPLDELRRAASPCVRALAELVVLEGADEHARRRARERLEPLLRDAEVAADVVDAITQAARPALFDLLAGALERVPPDLQCRALALLSEHAPAGNSEAERQVHRLLGSADPAVRAAATRCLGGRAASESGLARLAALLDDPSPLVRRQAGDALAAGGGRALDLLGEHATGTGPGGAEAARALASIGTRPARALLDARLAAAAAEARRNTGLRRRLHVLVDRDSRTALRLALEDHDLRIFDLAMGVLAASGDPRLADRLRLTLRASDQRTRANAFEALVSLPNRRFLAPIAAILNEILLAGGGPAPGNAAACDLLGEAETSADPWVRHAARFARARLAGAPASVGCVAARRKDLESGGTAMIPGERDMERILLLKQVPLFRYLPLDTLLAVGRVLESRRYRAGQEVVGEGARLDHLHIVESGTVAIARRHRSERLAAPACFGEAALVGEVPSFRRVVALEDVTLIRLHRVIFEDLSRDHPEIATELSRLLARRLRQLEGGGQAGAAP